MALKKIAIVTGPLAPYRLDLYESLGRAYQGEAVIDLVYGEKSPTDHNWSNLLEDSEFYNLKFAACRRFPNWVSVLLRMCKLGRGQPRLPTRAVWKVLSDSKPDAIWLSEINPYTMMAFVYAKLNGIKIWMATEVGATNHSGDASFFTKQTCGLGAKFVDTIIACSPHATRTLWRHRNEIILAPHAVKNKNYLLFRAEHSYKEAPVILFVGNCIYRKGADLLIAALGELKKQEVKFHLRIVGGSDVSWLSDDIEANDMSGDISFSGFVEGDALKSEYKNADIFVLPTRHDTYAVVTHEAAICGLPLLISKHAGSSEVLVNEKNGYVVDPEDQVQFAERIREFIISDKRRSEAGEESIKLASRWGVDENAKLLKRKLQF